MDVVDRLPGVWTCVDDDPETRFIDGFLAGYFGAGEEKFAQQVPVVLLAGIEAFDVFAWDDQDVSWGLGIYVLESDDLVVLVEYLGTEFLVGYIAEDTFWHSIFTPEVSLVLFVKHFCR